MIQDLIEIYPEESFIKADGFDDAIIGVEESSMRLIYSVSKCIDILCNDMSLEHACEYFNFNVRDTYVGDKTPIWCADNFGL
jgi:hypothetical protein